MQYRRLDLVFIVLSPIFFGPRTGWASGPILWITPSLSRTGPSDPVPASASTSVNRSAAKGEYQSFQIIVKAPTGGLTNVALSNPNALTGPYGTIPALAATGTFPRLNLSAFRETYVTVTHGSPAWPGCTSCPLGPGTYADGLIPANDPDTVASVSGGALSAFPFNLAAGSNQPLWIDIFVPRTTPAGSYAGVFTVSSDQGSSTVSLTLTVWNFTLPLSPSLKTSFLTWDSAHKINTDLELLRNRIEPKNVTSAAEAQGLVTNWGYNATDLGFYSGVDNGCETPASPPTSAAIANAQSALTSLGLFIYDYSFDEIGSCSSTVQQAVINWATALHSAIPAVSQLITMVPSSTLMAGDGLTSRPAVDIWTGLAGDFGDSTNLQLMAQAQAKGDQIWSYTTLVQEPFSPKWEIDFNPLDYRLFIGFMNQSVGATGSLYWKVDGWLSGTGAASWTNVDFQINGGHFPGEAILVYPGEAVGMPGKVAPSMRLKWLRDGVQDYEYVQALKSAGQTSWVMSQVQAVAQNMQSWTQNAGDLDTLHAQLGAKLNSLAGPPLPSPCDINGDGLVNIADVQEEINMALKLSPCTNPSGQCSILQAQKIINAALGRACVIP